MNDSVSRPTKSARTKSPAPDYGTNAILVRYWTLMQRAMDKLAVEEPDWPEAKRMRVARSMVDAFLSGYLREGV